MPGPQGLPERSLLVQEGNKKPLVLEDEGPASAVPPRFAACFHAGALTTPTIIRASL